MFFIFRFFFILYFISGTVPVYLGDTQQLRKLLPHPKAAIFVSDYNGDYNKLGQYLTYLSTNETAYEEHREWRKNFNFELYSSTIPLLKTSWECAVCRWAAYNSKNITHEKTNEICAVEEKKKNFSENLIFFSEKNNTSVKIENKNELYFLGNDTLLHLIPDIDTIESLNIDVDDTISINDSEFEKCKVGDPIPPIGEWPKPAPKY